MRLTFLFCAGWAALAGFTAFGDDKQPKAEEVKPLALAEVELLVGDWELAVDPKKSALKAMRATLTIKERKTASKPPGGREHRLPFHYGNCGGDAGSGQRAPGGIDFQPVAKGSRRYLQLLPEVPVKPSEKLLVEFTLEKDVWTINASANKQYFFPGSIPDLELSWDKLVWKRVPKKGKIAESLYGLLSPGTDADFSGDFSSPKS